MGAELVDATVTHVEEVACANTDEEMGIRCNETTFEVTSGTPDGESATFEVPVTEASVQLEAGDKVVLGHQPTNDPGFRSEEHTSELQSLMRISYAVFCLKKKKK